MTALKGLDARLVDLGYMVLGGVAVWWVTSRLAAKVNQSVDVVTKPIGSLLSDVTAGLNGWQAVELAPLLVRAEYLTADYRLNDDAESVLWGIPQYQPYLERLFGGRGAPLKPKYYQLIDVPIKG